MKIYIELILILVLMIMFIIWYLWNKYTIKKLIKNYNPKEDKGKLAEEKRLETQNGKTKQKGGENSAAKSIKDRGTESDVGTTSEDSNGLEQPEGRKLLPTTNIVDDGKTSNSNRKNGNGIRKLLGRRRK